MGTNYYVKHPKCERCGHQPDDLHIGKSSAGWCFALHVYPEKGIYDLPDWKREWAGKPIADEYGKRVSKTEMLRTITKRESRPTKRKPPVGYRSWADFHATNHSVPGPRGLLRHTYNVHRHGAGTWDCVTGDFS